MSKYYTVEKMPTQSQLSNKQTSFHINVELSAFVSSSSCSC